jgi:hypothetical protein
VKPYLRSSARYWLHRIIPVAAHRSDEQAQADAALGYVETGAHGFINLFHYFGATANKYQMSRYPTDVLLLKADEVWPTQPWDYGWGAYVDGGLDIRTVPGNHNSMFYPENAPALAAALSAELLKHD